MRMLGEWFQARPGEGCPCRPITRHLVVDSFPGSLIRTVKFQVNGSSFNANSDFCSCNHWAANGVIDGCCQWLRWMEINT